MTAPGGAGPVTHSDRAQSDRAQSERRICVRVLKVLGRGPAALTLDAGTARLAVGDGASGRELSLPVDVLERLFRDDLASHDKVRHRVSITDAGLAWLRRALAEGDAFTGQHRDLVRTTLPGSFAGGEAVTLDLRESPLGWLSSRRRPDGKAWVSRTQLAAGERLRADYTRAQMVARVTADWSRSIPLGRRRSGESGGRSDLSDAALDARDRVRRALAAVGPELSGVLVDVCCELKRLEGIEKANGWPARSGKVALSLALDSLAAHYGLHEHAQGRSGGRIRHWGDDGYRPVVDGEEGG